MRRAAGPSAAGTADPGAARPGAPGNLAPMSLNRPVVALGVLVVVALGIVGGEVAYASGQPKPAPFVSVSQSNAYTQAEPTCWNNGKPLDAQAIKSCTSSLKAKKNKLSISVDPDNPIAFGISDTGAAQKGWYLTTGGGSSTSQYKTTYQHLQLGSSAFQSSNTLTLSFVEGDPQTGATYGVWSIDIKNKNA
jgi:hypothetical protein